MERLIFHFPASRFCSIHQLISFLPQNVSFRMSITILRVKRHRESDLPDSLCQYIYCNASLIRLGVSTSRKKLKCDSELGEDDHKAVLVQDRPDLLMFRKVDSLSQGTSIPCNTWVTIHYAVY